MSDDVSRWFETYDGPIKPLMLRVREIILEDVRVTEAIKWRAPTFMFGGNMATFNPRSKRHLTLMFHTGATIPGTHPRLVGDGDLARSMSFNDLDDVEATAVQLRAVVAAWCDSRPVGG